MKKETLKRNLYQVDRWEELLEHMAELLPDETDFGIFQVNPDASIRVLHPIERPGFSERELLQHIRSDEEMGEAFEQVSESISAPFIIEISVDGEMNKLSLPDTGEE